MKRLILFLLLGIFLYNQVGYFIAFKLLQQQARKEIKKKLKNSVPESELAVFTFSRKEAADLQWVKEGKEFMHNGSMYDVVRAEEHEGAITYHCVNDEQEKQLFVDLEKHVYDHIAAHAKNKEVKKTFVKDYFCEAAELPLAIDYVVVEFPVHPHHPFTGYTSEITHPPRS